MRALERSTRGAVAIVAAIALAVCAPTARSDEPRIAKHPSVAFDDLVASRAAGDAAAEERAIAALAAFPPASVRAVLERVADPARPDDDVRAALLVLERVGTAEDLAIAVKLARAELLEESEAAVVAIAARGRGALAALETLARANAPFRATAARAVERVGTVEAAEWLARCTAYAPDERPEVLARIDRLVERLPQSAPDSVLDAVRSALAGVGSGALREAVIAAGRIEDGDSIPYLVPLLGEADAGLRADARWALVRISGLELCERVEDWQRWYEGELAWWREESDAAFAGLESAEPAARTRALLAIAGRRASRDRLSLRVAALLEDADASVARLAARTLAGLRSKVAIEPLRAALASPDAGLAREAGIALRALDRNNVPDGATKRP